MKTLLILLMLNHRDSHFMAVPFWNVNQWFYTFRSFRPIQTKTQLWRQCFLHLCMRALCVSRAWVEMVKVTTGTWDLRYWDVNARNDLLSPENDVNNGHLVGKLNNDKIIIIIMIMIMIIIIIIIMTAVISMRKPVSAVSVLLEESSIISLQQGCNWLSSRPIST